MRPEVPCQLAVVIFTFFHHFPIPDLSLAATHKLPYRLSGASISPSKSKKRKERTEGGDRGKVQSRAALVRPPHHKLPGPPLPRSKTQSHSKHSHSPWTSWGGKVTILPALVFRKNCRTAGVALSSRESSLTVGARTHRPSRRSSTTPPGPAFDKDVMPRLSLATTAPSTLV